MSSLKSKYFSIMASIFFVMFILCNFVYASDNNSKEDLPSDKKNVVETYSSDILDEKDEDLFADFDKIIEEDLDVLFDEISTSEDVEEEEMSPELFDDEIADDIIVEKSLLTSEDETDLIKD